MHAGCLVININNLCNSVISHMISFSKYMHNVHNHFGATLVQGARVFSLNFCRGTSKFWSPSVANGDKVGWGGLANKNLTEAKTAHQVQN